LLSVLGALGADPVNMPMGEVYSALSKGVIDGVVAPADTFRSLHFTEVARHFNTLAVPRGAYPARAMGLKRWNTLSEAQRAILEQGIPVWEAALAQEVRAAWQKGYDDAVKGRIAMTAVSPEDQERFDALYLRDAERNARALSRFGIDGMRAFRAARAAISDGKVRCQGEGA
jgi:TRAP-type C4-dicarboxylate transport system substrate-binding protein